MKEADGASYSTTVAAVAIATDSTHWKNASRPVDQVSGHWLQYISVNTYIST